MTTGVTTGVPGVATGVIGVSTGVTGVSIGATTITDGDGSRLPSANELAGARYQGRTIAETAVKLHG